MSNKKYYVNNVWDKEEFRRCALGKKFKMQEILKYLKRCIKWSCQRIVRGYAECDVWNMDGYLQRLVPDMLQDLKDNRNGLNVGNDLGIETLNVIKFPVSKYESIYRCKRLQHSSSYQVYSAIFTFEYVSYLSRAIAENNPGELFRIGVIAPYRAQADMIDKLLASENFPKEVNVQVGTIHGFQGDECDIIFAVFNTPPSISASKEMFLNKKNTKAFLSKQYDNYRKPYGTRAEDIPRQCVFAGTSKVINFLPLDRSGNRRFLPIMCDASRAEVHILENEAESRVYIEQMWAEIMVIYRQGKIRLKLPKGIEKHLIEYQRPFCRKIPGQD